MGDPTDLIASLEATGNVVYPIRSTIPMLRTGQLDSIAPSAVINMAHGRLGDGMVRFLEKYNIPLFSPLNVNSLVSDWEADEMGMAGGFLSQSVVTPEIDGCSGSKPSRSVCRNSPRRSTVTWSSGTSPRARRR